jgi:hypothetical protein
LPKLALYRCTLGSLASAESNARTSSYHFVDDRMTDATRAAGDESNLT